MSGYCTHCGIPLHEKALFCSGCGTKVEVIPGDTTGTADQPAAFLMQPGAAYQDSVPHTFNPLAKKFGQRNINPGSAKRWLIGGAVVTGVVITISLLFSSGNADGKGGNSDHRFTDGRSSGTVVPPSPEAEGPMNKTGQNIQNGSVSSEEKSRAIAIINAFYDAENNEDVPRLLSYYHFPVDRYYQLYNVGYDQLNKMVVDAFNGRLYYHNINIKWDYSTVQRSPSGNCKVLLYADYTSASEGQDDRITRNLHLVILLDEEMKITAIYPG